MGETVFYSVRVDKLASALAPGWFFTEAVEQDPYPTQPPQPTMRWDAHRLEIESSAIDLSGSIERREGDLTLVRSYVRPPKHGDKAGQMDVAP